MSSRAWSHTPIGLITTAGLLLVGGPAAAQVQSEKLTVQATIEGGCTVTNASLNFGQSLNIDELGNIASTNGQGTIEISCTATTDLGIELDGGLNFDTSNGIRRMAGPGSNILYSLYSDAARETLWDVGVPVGVTITGTEEVDVYGRVPPQPNHHSAGLYEDQVTITLSFN